MGFKPTSLRFECGDAPKLHDDEKDDERLFGVGEGAAEFGIAACRVALLLQIAIKKRIYDAYIVGQGWHVHQKWASSRKRVGSSFEIATLADYVKF